MFKLWCTLCFGSAVIAIFAGGSIGWSIAAAVFLILAVLTDHN